MSPKVLIIGASGFIGSNLLKEFERQSIEVRACSRHPQDIFSEEETTELSFLDLEDVESIERNLNGVTTIYYLAHAMGYGKDKFSEKEKAQAQNLAGLLNETHKLIYLGGIARDDELSEHLQSRKTVGEIFRKTKAKTIEFQASIVIGKGSASFEMIRALVYRLPFIVSAEWAHALCQPIALKDVVTYLTLAQEKKFRKKHSVFEIGGSDQLTYRELLVEFSKHEKLFRPEIKLQKFPKDLAIEIMKIVIPEYVEVGAKLLGSIEIPTTVKDNTALEKFEFTPISFRESLELAQDTPLKEIEFSEILNRLKGHPEIPSYLAGQTLQLSFTYRELKGLDKIAQRFKLHDIVKEHSIKIPFAGELKITNNEERELVNLAYRPKYFFQALGWSFFERVAREIKK